MFSFALSAEIIFTTTAAAKKKTVRDVSSVAIAFIVRMLDLMRCYLFSARIG